MQSVSGLLKATILTVALTACKGEGKDNALSAGGESAPVPEDYGTWLSFAPSASGDILGMAYYDRSSGALGFGVGTLDDEGSVTWKLEQVDGYPGEDGLDRGDRGKYASMAISSDDTVWIAYQDVSNGALYAARRPNQEGLGLADPNPTWDVKMVDPGNGSGAGMWASLALNADGQPVIASYDGSKQSLKLSRFTPGGAEQQWSTTEVWSGSDWNGTNDAGEPISRSADAGQYARLHIDGGTERIAFYDAAHKRMGLLEGSGSDLAFRWVTPEGTDMGQWPSMLVAGGTLYIAFHDVENQNLMLATAQGQGFTLETVDNGDYVGADTEIVTRGGKLQILYFDGHHNDMKLATRSGAVWVSETIAGQSAALGFHNEIARIGDRWVAGSYSFTSKAVETIALD